MLLNCKNIESDINIATVQKSPKGPTLLELLELLELLQLLENQGMNLLCFYFACGIIDGCILGWRRRLETAVIKWFMELKL